MSTADSRKRLGHLRRALAAATSSYSEHVVAASIAALGTPAAYECLTSEVIAGGSADAACRAALREAGAAAVPQVLASLRNNPSVSGLVMALPDVVDADGANRLVAACRRTQDPWVVCFAAKRITLVARALLPGLAQALKARESAVVTAALNLGVLAAHPEKLATHLPKYLQPDMDPKVQRLALVVAGQSDLPEVQEAIGRLLTSRLVRDRCFALSLIGFAGRAEFAAQVLACWIEERSPMARRAAFDAMLGLKPEVAAHLGASAAGTFDSLARASRQGAALQAASENPAPQDVAAGVRAVRTAVDQVNQVIIATYATEEDGEAPYRLLEAMPPLMMAAAVLRDCCLDAGFAAQVCPVVDALLHTRLGILRTLWVRGQLEVRLLGTELLGRCTVALHEKLPPPPSFPPTSWDDLLKALMRLAEEATTGGNYLSCSPMPHLDYRQWPLLSHQLRGRATGDAVLAAPRLVGDVEAKSLRALDESLNREARARRLAVRDAGGADELELAEQAVNDRPLIVLSAELARIEPALQRPKPHDDEGATGQLSAVERVQAEHHLQAALLGIVSQALSPAAVPLLVRCLRSGDALVSECAEHLLVRLGAAGLSEVLGAIGRAGGEVERARLLEVARCIDPAAAVETARGALKSRHPLVCAVSARIIGVAGTRADVPALRARYGRVAELVDVCLVQALSKLNGEANVEVFIEAVGSPYPGLQWAALGAVAALPPARRAAIVGELRDSPNAFHQLAADAMTGPDGEFRSVTIGFEEAYPAAGDFALGARLACRGTDPWAWGVPALFREEGFEPERYRLLLAGSQPLAAAWVRYASTGQITDDLVERLHEIACGPGSEGVALARELLWDLHRDGLGDALSACLGYHGVAESEQLGTAATEAFGRALQAHRPATASRLVAPNASARNPLAEAVGLPGEGMGHAVEFGLVLYMRFRDELPHALGIAGLALAEVTSQSERASRIEAEWQALMQYQDLTHGFAVKPRLDFADLAWYCRRKANSEAARRQMIDYLAASFTILPAFPEDREAALKALEEIFAPLIGHTAQRLRGLWGKDAKTRDPRGTASREFHRAVADYDAFWPQSPSACAPLGTVGAMADSLAPDERYALKYEPLAHYAQRRLGRFVRLERARVRRAATQDTADEPDLEAAQAHDAETVHREREDALAKALVKGKSVAEALDDMSAIKPVERAIPTSEIIVAGESVHCVDIETLAAQLEVTPAALRQRDRRGKIEFTRDGGTRYFPLASVGDLRASLFSETDLARSLGVARTTLYRWRQEAPGELSPRKLVDYLTLRAATSRSRRAVRPPGSEGGQGGLEATGAPPLN